VTSRPFVTAETCLPPILRALLIAFFAAPIFAAMNPVEEPMLTLSLHELKFAAQPQGTASAPQQITLSNIGNAELAIHSITISGENNQQFIETHDCPTAPATLSPNTVCQIQVVFKPLISGDLAATLSVSDNASGSPQTVALEGHSGAPAPAVLLSPVVLAFGTQRVGANSKMQVVLLKNTGSAPLNINSVIRIDGASASEFHFHTVHEPCPETTGEVAPNASCSVGIVFAPVSSGAKNAQLIIEDDAAGSPHTVELSGSGV
jgi:Abnormal spindle-like microcephaly-assoc'd, ASPM-SPD-2-Hydin